MMRRILTGVCMLMVGACGMNKTPPAEPAEVAAPVAPVTLMTFNVENLFDAEDDAGKNDHAYLPVAMKRDAAHITFCEAIDVPRWRKDCLELDWNEAAVDFKLRQLAKTILQVNNGRGPDVIALQEVENIGILTRLSRDYLQAAGYDEVVLIEGRDLRGIDMAFLSRLPLAGEPVLHDFDATGFSEREGDTRGILEATFTLPDGRALTGFAVHFPAPYHPIEMRELAYDLLNELRAQVPPGHFVFAAGDFNTPSREMTETTIMDDRVRPFWQVAHEAGCEGCKGTNYWARGDSWSFLDMVLFSPANTGGDAWHMPDGGVFIADKYNDQRNDDGTVKRFDLDARRGVSDHLPLVMTLEFVAGYSSASR